jgi:choline dehydrogenase-like flavoprotein
MPAKHYDVIVVGSGPGGATLAQRLAPTGKQILVLERGDYLPRSQKNWDAKAVFQDGIYQAQEDWYDRAGRVFHPGLHYFVGGNSKVYGSALLRLRERDFEALAHEDGMSPAWPLTYADYAPYYDEAEKLFQVHGQAGEDPTEPARGAFPYPAVTHEPRIAALHDRLTQDGLKPFHLPLGILLDEKNGRPTPTSICIKCDAFDGFPCLLNGKADAQVVCIDPMLAAHPNVKLLTGAYVEKLTTDAAGRSVTGVEVKRGDLSETFTADIVVVACGALSSALLLLRSANDAHPDGLANGSGQVGRNYMRHNQSVLMALSRERNDTVFQKTLALTDWYFGAHDYEFPMGLVQMCAATHSAQIKGEALPAWLEWLPNVPFEQMAKHSMDFWLSSEDLPLAENRICYQDGKVVLEFTETNMQAHRQLRKKLQAAVQSFGMHPKMVDRNIYFGMDIPLAGTSHQAGTARFGSDPAVSVLDLNCKAHELDNLYLADASFFPSIGAVNPTLTIVANAMRVADHLKARLAA